MSQGDKKGIGRIALRQKAVRSSGRAPATAAGDGELAADERDTLKGLSERYGVPALDLRQVCIRLEDLELIPREIARRHVILPVLVRDDRLFVAMANPLDKKVIDELEFVTDKRVFPYVAPEALLGETLEEAYSRKARGEPYYVGPNCPPEVQRKLGVLDDDASMQFAPPGLQPSDHQLGTVEPEARSSEIAEEDSEIAEGDFSDLSEELSGISELPEEEPSSAPAGAKTVLVVDDEDDIRSMLQKLLKARGYHVVASDSGRTALKMVKEHAPDLIVLDAMLPEIHGFDIARRIKASKRYGHIPIVMVSAVYRGWRFAEDLKESCGVAAYIEKPFRIAEVAEAVEAALAPQKQPEPEGADEQIKDEAERELNAGVAAYKAGRLEDAIGHLSRGIEIDPLAYRLHFHLGLLYGKKGQVYDAIGELERAVEINSRHFPAVKNLAILYQKAGFRNKATEMWERALNVAPDDQTRQSIKQHLVSLL